MLSEADLARTRHVTACEMALAMSAMVEGHPASKLDELLPWNWKPAAVNG